MTLSEDRRVIMNEEGGTVPEDPENRDFQAYLEWVAAGNTTTEWTPE